MEVEQGHDQKDEYYVNYWNPLRITIQSFLQPEPQNGLSSFHETFTLVYKCVCDNRATRLYSDLIGLCTSHLKSVNANLMQSLTTNPDSSQTEKALNIIKSFDEELVTYLSATSNISSVFCYLVKYLEEKTNYSCPLDSQLKKIFCEEVAEHYVYDILEYLENSPSAILDPVLVQRLLNNLHFVSQGKYSARYFKLFSRFGIESPIVTYEQARLSDVKHLQANSREEQVGSNQLSDCIIGLNRAQKRRADERD